MKFVRSLVRRTPPDAVKPVRQSVRKPESEGSNEGRAQETEKPTTLEQGVPTVQDLLAPGGIDRSRPDRLRVGDRLARAFAITSPPSEVSIGWLGPFLAHEGEVDLAIHIAPYDQRQALNELTRLAARLESQWYFVRGRIGVASDLARAAEDTKAIRELVSSNQANLYRVSILSTVYASDEEELERTSQVLETRLVGGRVFGKWLECRMDEGYLSATPIGWNFCADIYRNLDSFAASTLFPFVQADLHHPGGFQLGINMVTKAPILFDPYDNLLNNHNIVVYAASGSGKSATVKIMTARATFTGEITAIIDPEGEYRYLASALDGAVVILGPESGTILNPFDVWPEVHPETGERFVNLMDKIRDLIELVKTMAQRALDPTEVGAVERAIRSLYAERGITRDPESIWESVRGGGEGDGGVIRFGRRRKAMPTISDLVAVLEKDPYGQHVAEALRLYTAGSVYGFFDGQSTVQIDGQRVVVFDLSRLDNSLGKQVGLQVTLGWLWTTFVVKNERKLKKRIVVDEAWLMADYEPAMLFLENVVRRARKYVCGLTVISQDFRKFALHPRGPAIHSNSQTFIFLRMEDFDLEAAQEMFHLSDGETAYLQKAQPGEGVVRIGRTVIPFKVVPTPWEASWAFTSPLRQQAR